jgi:hypothetical protein
VVVEKSLTGEQAAAEHTAVLPLNDAIASHDRGGIRTRISRPSKYPLPTPPVRVDCSLRAKHAGE